jgi:hypothetical protein
MALVPSSSAPKKPGGAGGSTGLVGGYELGEKVKSAGSESSVEVDSGTGIPMGRVLLYDLLRGVGGDAELDCEADVVVDEDE